MIGIIYFVAAVAPALLLWLWVYHKDAYEKEPMSLIRKLIFGGIFAVVASVILELLTDGYVIPNLGIWNYEDYAMMTALSVGVIEEGTKFYFLTTRTWHSKEFNYRYDAVVYAVTVGLTFAAVENVMYIFEYGLGIALQRALLSIPAHMTFGVLMGLFYGRAKQMELTHSGSPFVMNVLALSLAVTAHTAYDAALLIGSDSALLFFAVFVIAMYLLVFRAIRREARNDHRIG